jgi:hypothetical protein
VSEPQSLDEVDRQLPIDDEIVLDHVGHFVAGPEAASRALQSAGFAPTPPSVQVNPLGGGRTELTGTGNVTAMFRRGYIEALFKTADTPLGRELDAAMARYPGVHLAAFAVSDAAGAHRRLGHAGFRLRPLVEMQRPAPTEAGEDIAAFTVVRVEPGEMPEGRIQLLTHRTEHTVWQRRWLDHPNTAQALLDLVIVAADVAETAERFARFTGRTVVENAWGKFVRLDRGGVQIADRAAFGAAFPDIRDPAVPFMAVYGVRVASIATARQVMASGLQARGAGGALIVRFPDALGRGAWLFVERAGDLPWRSRGS